MKSENVLWEVSDHYAIVTINRPQRLNALNAATVEELQQVMSKLQQNKGVRAVILTGAGEKAFVAGADISEVTQLNERSAKEFAKRGQTVFRFIETMSKPVIAAVNGFALGGGCELAMACHLRIASTAAKFGQPEINLGLSPGYGGTQRLPRLIGKTTALYFLLTGEMIDAYRALQLGLVSEVVEPQHLVQRSKSLAAILSEKAPLAVQYILETFFQGGETDLETALDIEARCFGKLCGTEDMKEGTAAFLQKRKPLFKGK